MKYATGFALVGGVLVWRAFQMGGWGFLLLWPGFALVAVGFAYARTDARPLGKRADGYMCFWNVVFLLPYLLMAWSVWSLQRLLTRGPAGQEVSPGIWLGRRPYLGELPPDIRLVVDMTSEFPADRPLRRKLRLICLPTLDGGVPSDRAFLEVLTKLAAEHRPVFIHCALGHGRSASLAAALLISKGIAADVESAQAILRKVRPGVKLNKAQRSQVTRLTQIRTH